MVNKIGLKWLVDGNKFTLGFWVEINDAEMRRLSALAGANGTSVADYLNDIHADQGDGVDDMIRGLAMDTQSDADAEYSVLVWSVFNYADSLGDHPSDGTASALVSRMKSWLSKPESLEIVDAWAAAAHALDGPLCRTLGARMCIAEGWESYSEEA